MHWEDLEGSGGEVGGRGDRDGEYMYIHGWFMSMYDKNHCTTVSLHGGDSGIDITAYKDELPPRILVQVKSQDGDIKETTIQSLKGALREGDYGLFVTLSNYTKNAQKYLDNTPIIRGINGKELVDLILKYYDKLSEKYRKMIPLKMVYIPVINDM